MKIDPYGETAKEISTAYRSKIYSELDKLLEISNEITYEDLISMSYRVMKIDSPQNLDKDTESEWRMVLDIATEYIFRSNKDKFGRVIRLVKSRSSQSIENRIKESNGVRIINDYIIE